MYVCAHLSSFSIALVPWPLSADRKNKHRGQIVIDRAARQEALRTVQRKSDRAEDEKSFHRLENTRACTGNVKDKIPASPAIAIGISNDSGAAFPKSHEKLLTINKKHGFFFCRLCLPRFLCGYKAQRVMCLSMLWWYVGGVWWIEVRENTSRQQIRSDTHVCRQASTHINARTDT